ncbi:MAG TPA: PRC-barrel domain-containing protein [Acidimicrobiales bacterium]|nr:PRC-barrel domain-containing protein [Acidimicrobiales bacterium]
MTSWRALKGTKVMSKASAEKVGSVDRLVIDVGARRITAVQVAKGDVVAWEAISGIGDDAVIIDDRASVRSAAEGREARTLKGDLDIAGRRVLSDTGNLLGHVDDVELDEATGTIEAIVTDQGRLDGDRLRAIGSWCVVVAHDPDHAARQA